MQFVLVLGVMQIMIKGVSSISNFLSDFDDRLWSYFLLLFRVALPIKGTEGVR